MAMNIWVDENAAQRLVTPSSIKPFQSARKHTQKKQAFGELKNLLHAEGGATPFRGALKQQQADGFGANLLPSKSLCNEVLRKQQLKQNFCDAQKQLERKLPPVLAAPLSPANKLKPAFISREVGEIDEYEFEEINTKPCVGHCEESLAEIWSNMQPIDDAFINKVIAGGDPESDEEGEYMDITEMQFEDKDYDFEDAELKPVEEEDEGIECDFSVNNLCFDLEATEEMTDFFNDLML